MRLSFGVGVRLKVRIRVRFRFGFGFGFGAALFNVEASKKLPMTKRVCRCGGGQKTTECERFRQRRLRVYLDKSRA